jgi:predicted peptidase
MENRSSKRMNRRTLPKWAGIMTSVVAAGLTALVATSPVAAQAAAPVETGFLNGQVTTNGKTMRYVVYVPRNYVPEKEWPVILFLHGGWAEGEDGFRPLFLTLPPKVNPYQLPKGFTWGGSLGAAVTLHPERFPCLVVWPQVPTGESYWIGRTKEMALQALEEVVQRYNGDRNRIFLTGLSLGGDGTWRFAAEHPDLFAAAMPIANSGQSVSFILKRASALKSLPLWVFHGADDKGWPPSVDRKLVAAIQAAGNTNIRYTEYPGVDHNSWDITYNDPQVIAWLLAQKR